MGDTILVRVEGDLVFIRNQRIMTLEDHRVMAGVVMHVRSNHGSVFVMFDCSRSEGIERAARKVMSERSMPEERPNAIAIFGAPFAIRTLGNMIDRALVGLGRPSTGMRFFETETQAREYLQQERLNLQPNG